MKYRQTDIRAKLKYLATLGTSWYAIQVCKGYSFPRVSTRHKL